MHIARPILKENRNYNFNESLTFECFDGFSDAENYIIKSRLYATRSINFEIDYSPSR